MILNEVVRFCKIAEQEDEAAKFQECHDIAREINMQMNEMLVAGRIEDFPGDISNQVISLYGKEELKSNFSGRIIVPWSSHRQSSKP